VFKCVDCGYEGSEFNAGVAEHSYHGAFTYFAKCPECGSFKIKPLPGYKESDLRIGVGDEGEKGLSQLLPVKPEEGPPLPRILKIGWPRGTG